VNGKRYIHPQGAPPEVPLCAVRSATLRAWCTILSRLVTETILTSAAILVAQLSCNADDVPARSCRAGGVTALLCGRVGTSIVQLVGRWRSDVEAGTLVSNLSSTMLCAGASISLIPGQEVPNVDSQRHSSSPRRLSTLRRLPNLCPTSPPCFQQSPTCPALPAGSHSSEELKGRVLCSCMHLKRLHVDIRIEAIQFGSYLPVLKRGLMIA
jgi:hypothetical protein